jgi:hypothetical protein
MCCAGMVFGKRGLAEQRPNKETKKKRPLTNKHDEGKSKSLMPIR